jgi:hypothetical protein
LETWTSRAKRKIYERFFESVLVEERGLPPEGDEGKKGWVARVRIVRDRETQLGKASVMFNFRYASFLPLTRVFFDDDGFVIGYLRTATALTKFWDWKIQSSNLPNVNYAYNVANLTIVCLPRRPQISKRPGKIKEYTSQKSRTPSLIPFPSYLKAIQH